jgi:hypothetical protein
MTRLVLFFSAFVLVGLLASCATLNKAQCEAGDWRSLGISDGERGYPLSYLSDHISACAEHGISVNRELYAAGREEGLQSYCRLDRAESEGRAGRINYNSCQGDIGVAFNRIYREARDVRDIEQKIAVANGQMDKLLQQITLPDQTDEQRASLRSQISNLQGSIRVLEDERRLEERQLRNAYLEEEKRLGL